MLYTTIYILISLFALIGNGAVSYVRRRQHLIVFLGDSSSNPQKRNANQPKRPHCEPGLVEFDACHYNHPFLVASVHRLRISLFKVFL